MMTMTSNEMISRLFVNSKVKPAEQE